MKARSKNWMKRCLQLFQRPPHKKIKLSDIAGYAILVKDDLMGKKYWVSYRGEVYDEVSFTEEQPLVFPPRELPPGTRVYLLLPKDKD